MSCQRVLKSRRDTYQIAAGSKVIFKNGAFIYSEAPISAIGTHENPIIFEGGDNLVVEY